MLFTAPVPFSEAVQARAVKRVLPMELDSAEYRRLWQELIERAIFGAKISNALVLQKLDDLVTRRVRGVTPEDIARRAAGEGPLLLDVPQMKLELKRFIESTDYQPPEGKEGTIQDLTSDRRIDLLIETNIQTAEGYGKWKAGQNEVTLDLWPAWELFRLVEPLGKPRDWTRRWRIAGGQLVSGGRMVALKNSPIWERIGSPTLFADGLGNPYPPFAFNSGMDVRDISRDEAVRLGLMREDDPAPSPQDRGFNDDLAVQAEQFNEALRQQLAADPALEISGGVLKLRTT